MVLADCIGFMQMHKEKAAQQSGFFHAIGV